MSLLISYSIRILPGLILLSLLYLLLTKKESMLRIFILFLAFIMMRDTMTPMGIWTFGQGQGIIWFRFINDSFVLISLALLSGIFSIIVLIVNQNKLTAVNWTADSTYLLSLLYGFLGSLLTVGPFLILYLFIPIDLRGGLVSMDLWPALFIFCLLGNFLIIFRNSLIIQMGRNKKIEQF